MARPDLLADETSVLSIHGLTITITPEDEDEHEEYLSYGVWIDGLWALNVRTLGVVEILLDMLEDCKPGLLKLSSELRRDWDNTVATYE